MSIEELISMGHSVRDVWGYTPRQIAAYIFIAGKRRIRSSAHELSIGAAAARGEPKEVRKQIKKWGSEK